MNDQTMTPEEAAEIERARSELYAAYRERAEIVQRMRDSGDPHLQHFADKLASGHAQENTTDRLYGLYLAARTNRLAGRPAEHSTDLEGELAVVIGADCDAPLLTRSDLKERVRHGMWGETPKVEVRQVTMLGFDKAQAQAVADALAKPLRRVLEPAVPWKAIQDAAVAAGLQAFINGEGRLVLTSPRRFYEASPRQGNAGDPAEPASDSKNPSPPTLAEQVFARIVGPIPGGDLNGRRWKLVECDDGHTLARGSRIPDVYDTLIGAFVPQVEPGQAIIPHERIGADMLAVTVSEYERLLNTWRDHEANCQDNSTPAT